MAEAKVSIRLVCIGCREPQYIPGTQAGWEQWLAGVSPGEAFPEMAPEQREMLRSQRCRQCCEREKVGFAGATSRPHSFVSAEA